MWQFFAFENLYVWPYWKRLSVPYQRVYIDLYSLQYIA